MWKEKLPHPCLLSWTKSLNVCIKNLVMWFIVYSDTKDVAAVDKVCITSVVSADFNKAAGLSCLLLLSLLLSPLAFNSSSKMKQNIPFHKFVSFLYKDDPFFKQIWSRPLNKIFFQSAPSKIWKKNQVHWIIQKNPQFAIISFQNVSNFMRRYT